MKTAIIVLALACPKGYLPNANTCAYDPTPLEQAPVKDWASDEKPSRHPQPAWERGEVNAMMIKPMQTQAEEDKAMFEYGVRHNEAKKAGLEK